MPSKGVKGGSDATGSASQRSRKKKETDMTATTTEQSLLSYGVEPYQPKKGEVYMAGPQKAHFYKLLNNWKLALMEGVDATIHDLQASAVMQADPCDQASQAESFSLELRTRDRERKLIKKIEQAIHHLESGDYGFCNECGIEIGLRRLEARPTATLCIDCKTIAEVKEKRQ